MKILAIYGSNTGNTKQLMQYIREYFTKHVKCKFQLVNAKNIDKIDSFEENSLVILSSSTWGGISPTLQDDFANFWYKLDKLLIKDNKFAIIGLGDRYYPAFCKAVDFLSDDVIKYLGKLLVNSLSISDNWYDHKYHINQWINEIIDIITSHE